MLHSRESFASAERRRRPGKSFPRNGAAPFALAAFALLCIYLSFAHARPTVGRRMKSGSASSPPSVVSFFALDETHVWISAVKPSEPFLVRSRDSGTSWERIPVPDTIYRLFFLNPDQGWAIYGSARAVTGLDQPNIELGLAGTRDGGRSWTHLSTLCVSTRENGILLASIGFADPLHGLIVGHQNEGRGAAMYETHDGGLSIKENREVTKHFGELFQVRSDGTGGLLVVGNDAVLRKKSARSHWETLLSPQSLSEEFGGVVLSAGSVPSAGHILLVGGGSAGHVLSSADSGKPGKFLKQARR